MGTDTPLRVRPLVGAMVAGAFVVFAVVAEVVAGRNANSPVPAWAEKVAPLAWPQPFRVVWWLAVAAAMAAFRALLSRAGIPQRRSVVVLSVAPFLVFATGVALGTDWAAWH